MSVDYFDYVVPKKWCWEESPNTRRAPFYGEYTGMFDESVPNIVPRKVHEQVAGNSRRPAPLSAVLTCAHERKGDAVRFSRCRGGQKVGLDSVANRDASDERQEASPIPKGIGDELTK